MLSCVPVREIVGSATEVIVGVEFTTGSEEDEALLVPTELIAETVYV
jgi:hypothetical protein